MVSFYDYAILRVKTYAILAVLLLSYGCHNNAHIRTQKILKEGEQATSLSATIPVYDGPGIYHLHDYSENLLLDGYGFAGPRIEYTKVYGDFQSEKGFHVGLGLGEKRNDERLYFNKKIDVGLLLGAQKKKIVRNFYRTNSLKVGGVAEINLFSGGQLGLNLLPSVTTTTQRKKPFYIGAHSVLSIANNLNAYAAYRSTDSLGATNDGPWENHFENFKYTLTSVGLGLTAGYELIKDNSQSLLLQIDATITHNNLNININPKEEYNTLSYHYNSYQKKFFPPWKQSNKHIIPVFSGSLSWVFFKPKSPIKDPFHLSYPLQKTMFDPETGYRLKRKAVVFDPETGEKIISSNEKSYFEDGGFTEKQIVDLAKKNAREKHIGALWSFFGVTGVPSSAFGSVLGLVAFDEASDGTLVFPGFIIGGIFGAILPSTIAKESSKLTNVIYPPEIETKEQKTKYKDLYRSEVGLLRQKATAVGTFGGFIALTGFIMLMVVGN